MRLRLALHRLSRPLAQQAWPLARFWYRLWGLRLDGRPEDEVWYFAFGSNMHDSAFRERRGMRPSEWRVGRITGYRLRFNLGGRPKGRAAAANISLDEAAEVWGVLYRINRRQLLRLDASEGIPLWHYRHCWLSVEDGDGKPVEAVTYMADGNSHDGRPSRRYITLLRDGARAHGLPAHWLAYLDSVEPAE